MYEKFAKRMAPMLLDIPMAPVFCSCNNLLTVPMNLLSKYNSALSFLQAVLHEPFKWIIDYTIVSIEDALGFQ
jgi:hypothetical protein